MVKKKTPAQRVTRRFPEMIAHAELPTRYGRFTIYGFRGAGPLDEAVALVRGKVRGRFKSKRSAPLVRVPAVQIQEIGTAGTRSFAMPDGRRFEFTALRLPRTAGTFNETNWPRSGWNSPLFAAGRPRHWPDE